MRETKIMPSPFGWGEIGVRDYEAFINGSLLLKPNMDHMLTWPNIFIKNKTYIPFEWDYSDLESNILKYLKNDQERIDIAREGQKNYFESINNRGQSIFCDWFIKQINL